MERIITATSNQRIACSFRDPGGFLFSRDGVLYRQINIECRDHYDRLMQSGLYEKLVNQGLLIPHCAADITPEDASTAYKIIQPEFIPFISYPYEWCFSQLKDAALTTLRIQKIALQAGMSLKDASAYNIQFRNGKPVMIDTLSFEIYQEGLPWIAYRQFCQHFLAPLALMAVTDIRLNRLACVYIDGIPLDLASRLLPKSTWFRFSILTHIHIHAKSQKRFADTRPFFFSRKVSKTALLGVIDSLETAVEKLAWEPTGTEWGDYYKNTNYSPEALNDKQKIVCRYLDEIKPKTLWDMGANTGLFSRLASKKGIQTLSFDIDPAAVEKNYRMVKEGKPATQLSGSYEHVKKSVIIPLCLDLTNPSPAIGWANKERYSLIDRGPADTVMALSLIHHLAISNNLPFQKIAHFFSTLCQYLIIEFIPKSDSQVQRLLATREDIFPKYLQKSFEHEFSNYFRFKQINPIVGSERILYLIQNKGSISN